jgi:hypothetical protein
MRLATILSLFAIAASGFAADSATPGTNDLRGWLTNTFRPWLTRSYPEVNSKFYPDWLQDHPAGLQPEPFTNWLSDVFPDLETEMYPTWMDNFSPDNLGTNLPAWWVAVQRGRFSVSPTPRPIPKIVRGPYLQLATTNSMIVRWRTDLPTTSTVFYGSSPSRLSRNARANGIFTDHAVLITNLSPATTYYYGFGAVDTPLIVRWTNNIAFVTSTNGKMYVNKPETREQIAVASRPDTFVFTIKEGALSVTDPEQSLTANTTNSLQTVYTPKNAVQLTASNNHIGFSH